MAGGVAGVEPEGVVVGVRMYGGYVCVCMRICLYVCIYACMRRLLAIPPRTKLVRLIDRAADDDKVRLELRHGATQTVTHILIGQYVFREVELINERECVYERAACVSVFVCVVRG